MIVLMATVAEFEVGGLALALRADSPLSFRVFSTQPYLDQISGLKSDNWTGLCEQYPNLSRLVLDVLSILASSCKCKHMFSKLGNLLEPHWCNITLQLLAAIQCVRRWRRAGFSDDQAAEKSTITDREIELLYIIST